MKILALGASNSKNSINRQFAGWAADQLEGAEVTLLDLNDFELPIYSIDLEKESGIPDAVSHFLEHIKSSDGIVISMAEHNGAYSAAFKNIYDWASRVEQKVWSEKPMLLLSTSPGGRGGKTVLEIAANTFPRMGADLKATFSLPGFGSNFSAESGIADEALAEGFGVALGAFAAAF